ncbi:MurR/RpiR family transcriptional regulator [Paenibacillus thermoaerophilus]|uniref:MurR/RpiR family transcriptional regulator n=1 Tax=Paenibacillus thermoaerophilus TaxID=1215385 RepID=A0ABW2V528_9BACL|nr:MurR/RpiR family transcriptional regulator [Paenibacillus thermoaerophilus]TMV17942.1 MurR/RpiR family transcriptional regulator [Paenibacillus thermoaerophilus]
MHITGSSLTLLASMLPTLQPAEKRVAQYILAQPETVCRMSVHKLAEAAEASVATIARLSQKLGVSGFQELKLDIAARLGQEEAADHSLAGYEDIRPNMEPSEVVAQLSQWAQKCIEDTASVLSPELLKQAVAALIEARKTVFFGVASSSFVAFEAAHKWLRLDRWSHAYSDLQLMLTSAALLRKGDVAVAISYSGKTYEVLQAAKVAKENGATVISITQVGANPLHKLADIGLWVTATEAGMKRGNIGSRIALSHVIDILYMSLVSQSFESTVSRLEETHAKVQRKKEEA